MQKHTNKKKKTDTRTGKLQQKEKQQVEKTKE